MSYADATAFAASLAATLMVAIVVFQAGDGTHAACPDGDGGLHGEAGLTPSGADLPSSRPDTLRSGLQLQSPSAISRATIARAFIIRSSPEVSI